MARLWRLGAPAAEARSIRLHRARSKQLLAVFATWWEHRPPTVQTDEIRYHFVILDAPIRSAHVAVAFVAQRLRPDQIGAAYPTLVRDPDETA